MKRSEWEDRCKSHPEHRLSRGVCPFCLRERLTHLSASSSATNTTHASSSSAITPNSTDSNRSPGVAGASSTLPGRTAPKKERPMRNSEIFQKSRSIALDAGPEEKIDQKNKDKSKKKKKRIERFFSKIIHGPSKKSEGQDLNHSRTMKEKSAPKWVPL